MKFSEMPYTRPDVEGLKTKLAEIAKRIAAAEHVDEQIAAYDESVAIGRDYMTAASIAYVRNTINTADAFYSGEREYLDEVGPKLQEAEQLVSGALLDSRFRKELEAHC